MLSNLWYHGEGEIEMVPNHQIQQHQMLHIYHPNAYTKHEIRILDPSKCYGKITKIE